MIKAIFILLVLPLISCTTVVPKVPLAYDYPKLTQSKGRLVTVFADVLDNRTDLQLDQNISPSVISEFTTVAFRETQGSGYFKEVRKLTEITDPATSTSWDLGFLRNHVRTNSGSSGSGQGGSYDAGMTDFDAFTEVSESGYVVDDSIPAFDFAIMQYVSLAASTVLETWGTFTEEQPPTLELSNKVYAIKSADGKYAKIIFLNYYGTDGSGFVTFKYVYQADGSINLE